MTPYSGIILAGGKSSRLGVDKAFLKIGSKPIVVRAMEAMVGLCDEIVISANDPEPYTGMPVRVVEDIVPGGGSLVGLYSSLSSLKNEYAFVAACDMPFLSTVFIKRMMEAAAGYDALVPVYKGYMEPLHAVYSRRCLGAIKKRIDEGQRRMRSFYGDINIGYLDEDEVKKFSPDGLVFFNINTGDDVEKAKTIAAGG